MELLVYIGIMALIGAAIVQYTLGVSAARSKNEAVREVQAHGRMALRLVSERIRGAEGVNNSSSTFGADPGALSLAFATSTKNPTVIDLSADDGRMRIKEGTAAPVVITPETMRITNLVFTDLTSSSIRENVRVQFTIEYVNPSSDVIYDAVQTFQTSASVRQ